MPASLPIGHVRDTPGELPGVRVEPTGGRQVDRGEQDGEFRVAPFLGAGFVEPLDRDGARVGRQRARVATGVGQERCGVGVVEVVVEHPLRGRAWRRRRCRPRVRRRRRAEGRDSGSGPAGAPRSGGPRPARTAGRGPGAAGTAARPAAAGTEQSGPGGGRGTGTSARHRRRGPGRTTRRRSARRSPGRPQRRRRGPRGPRGARRRRSPVESRAGRGAGRGDGERQRQAAAGGDDVLRRFGFGVHASRSEAAFQQLVGLGGVEVAEVDGPGALGGGQTGEPIAAGDHCEAGRAAGDERADVGGVAGVVQDHQEAAVGDEAAVQADPGRLVGGSRGPAARPGPPVWS